MHTNELIKILVKNDPGSLESLIGCKFGPDDFFQGITLKQSFRFGERKVDVYIRDALIKGIKVSDGDKVEVYGQEYQHIWKR